MAALVFGIVGGVVLAFGFGVAALVRVRRRGGRGAGLAIGGMLAAMAWTTALVVGVTLVWFTSVGEGGEGSSYPRVGECFDMPSGRQTPDDTVLVPCEKGHEAELVAAVHLPKRRRPAADVLKEMSDTACEGRAREMFHTASPVEDGQIISLPPRRSAWPGDREARCAVAGPSPRKLVGRLAARPYEVRLWAELQIGDCFDVRESWTSVRLPGCTKPHDAQLIGRFILPADVHLDDRRSKPAAKAGCASRMEALTRADPDMARLTGRFLQPRTSEHAPPDREVFCFITADTGRGSCGGRCCPAAHPPDECRPHSRRLRHRSTPGGPTARQPQRDRHHRSRDIRLP
ncbi:septum formation family protein [Actinomadura yumaensis]|uniref:septum formation family protein n=1 Tax=Actinomadura yumaensis TaxID=111807 RepID=UPI003621000D